MFVNLFNHEELVLGRLPHAVTFQQKLCNQKYQGLFQFGKINFDRTSSIMNYPFRIIWRSLASTCILDFILFSEFVDIFATERHRKSKEQLKMNLVQLKLDWVSLPNLRNRSYLGESRKYF